MCHQQILIVGRDKIYQNENINHYLLGTPTYLQTTENKYIPIERGKVVKSNTVNCGTAFLLARKWHKIHSNLALNGSSALSQQFSGGIISTERRIMTRQAKHFRCL